MTPFAFTRARTQRVAPWIAPWAALAAITTAACVQTDTNTPRDASIDRPSRSDTGVSQDSMTGGECVPGETRDCYTGEPGTDGLGICRIGVQTCGASRSWSAACVGERTPAAMETCGNGQDDDCNGMVDDGCGECMSGASRPCYTGPAATMGVGICRGGTQTCDAARMWPSSCTGEVVPQVEVCGNGMDDNCNGLTDEMCGECTPGMTRSCYTGPMGTSGVGICRAGSQTCTASRTWPTTCTGEVRPAASEVCSNGMDDNCNGMTDEGCATAPPNDARANAIAIALSNTEVTRTGSTMGSTYDGPASCGVCTNRGNVWYSFTLSERTIVYADTAGSSFDTILMLTDAAGSMVAGACNDDAGCTSGGFTSSLQSRVVAALNAGTYYVSVGGCSQGNFTLNLQRIPASFVTFFFTVSPLSGSGTAPATTLISSSRRTPMTCGGGIGASGEDARYFISCGARPQLFSLCQSDGGSFVRRSGTTDYDPIMYLWSAQTGSEIACNDDGTSMGGTNCQGTGGDTLNFGSRLNNVMSNRGLHAIIIDERRNASGMNYTLRYAIQ